jgi:hypothetical protein
MQEYENSKEKLTFQGAAKLFWKSSYNHFKVQNSAQVATKTLILR